MTKSRHVRILIRRDDARFAELVATSTLPPKAKCGGRVAVYLPNKHSRHYQMVKRIWHVSQSILQNGTRNPGFNLYKGVTISAAYCVGYIGVAFQTHRWNKPSVRRFRMVEAAKQNGLNLIGRTHI